jgi:hypothetical protein
MSTAQHTFSPDVEETHTGTAAGCHGGFADESADDAFAYPEPVMLTPEEEARHYAEFMARHKATLPTAEEVWPTPGTRQFAVVVARGLADDTLAAFVAKPELSSLGIDPAVLAEVYAAELAKRQTAAA